MSEVDTDALVEEAGWPANDSFGAALRDFIEARIDGGDVDPQGILEDLRSYYSEEVVDAIERAWENLYGEVYP